MLLETEISRHLDQLLLTGQGQSKKDKSYAHPQHLL